MKIKTLIHGGAVGADLLAAHSVEKYNKELQESFDIDKMITIEEFPANWKKYGKSAGIIRNIDMLQNGDPDIVIGFPGGRGTAHMLDISQKADKAVFQVLDGPKGIEIINKKTGKKVEF